MEAAGRTDLYLENYFSKGPTQCMMKDCRMQGLVKPDSSSAVKNLPANAGDIGDVGSIFGSGRSPRGGNGNPLQHSCLGNPMDSGAWQATVQDSFFSQKNRT